MHRGAIAVGVRQTALPALGLACWISSLLAYSETITPFQDFGAPTFVGLFAERSLALGVLVALAASVFSFKGRHVPSRPLGVGAGVAYVLAAVLFGWFGTDGLPADADWLIWFLAACSALGSTGTALMWGRVYKRLAPRGSLGAVALAGFAAAAFGAVSILVPSTVRAVLLVLFALVAAVLPLFLTVSDPAPDTGLSNRPFSERLRSMASVTAPSLMGLLAFAYVMGTMRVLIVETYPVHVGALAGCSAILACFVLVRRWTPFVRRTYRNLIPALAVCLLAVTNVTLSLGGGSSADMAMTYLLYTLAALITLATLAAVVHAGEFSSDLVMAVAMALFCLASFVGLLVGGVVTSAEMRASTSVITTVYAFAVVLARGLQEARDEHPTAPDAFGPFLAPQNEEVRCGVPADALGTAGAQGEPAFAEEPRDLEAELERRCTRIAETYCLTAREAEILRYVARGHGSAYISEALYISQNTVRTHTHNLYRKLGVGSREDVIALVRESV